jgi:hypothetical protein
MALIGSIETKSGTAKFHVISGIFFDRFSSTTITVASFYDEQFRGNKGEKPNVSPMDTKIFTYNEFPDTKLPTLKEAYDFLLTIEPYSRMESDDEVPK